MYVRLCDQCSNKIMATEEWPIETRQQRTIHEHDVNKRDFCSWRCVALYAAAKVGKSFSL